MTPHDAGEASIRGPGAPRRGASDGAIAGGIAAALAAVVMLVLRLIGDVPSLPELLQEWITTWLPVFTLGTVLATFGEAAKPALFAALFAVYLLAGALLGALLGVRWAGLGALGTVPLSSLLLQGLLAGVALLLIAVIVLRSAGELPGIGLPFVLFGLLLPLCYRWLSPAPPATATARTARRAGGVPAPVERRRQQLERLGWGGVAAAGLLALWRYATPPGKGAGPGDQAGMGDAPGSRGSRRGPDGLPAEVTANADFYRVSKNLHDPRPDHVAWRMHVNGLVARPIVFTWGELRALPHREQWQTLICISNDVGGDYLGNALWSGVPVADLIRLAGGASSRATRVVFRAADGYSDSLPVAKAMEPGTLVATTMNGVNLPHEHGAPARLLIPGVYGLKNVKWLTSIEVIDTPYRGYWQERGWSDAAVVKTTARIDSPRRGAVPRAQAGRISGVAFAGDRGISRVEVSDDGATWRPARLAPPKGPLSWVFWELPWSPTPGAQYKLAVRAVDGTGALQAPEVAPALPDGASGYHTVTVRVS